MTDVATVAAEPVTKCGACGQIDDHPKHQILVGFNNPDTLGQMFHPHDHGSFNIDGTQDDPRPAGCIYYHFDCPTEWHDLHTKLGVHEDPDAHAQRMATADHHQRIIALCKSGVKGADLRAAIVGGQV